MAIPSHAFTRPAASGGTGQTDPLTNALLRQAFNYGPIRHPMQGIDQLGKAALLARRLREGKGRREGMAKTYADALYAGQTRPAESSGGIDWKAKLADPGMMARILTGNPDTAEFGMQLGLGEMRTQREQAHELAVAKTKREFEKAKAANERRWDAEKWEMQRQKKHADALELAGTKSSRLTQAQRANNSEIDEARARLREMERDLPPGVSLSDDIHRRISVTDPTTGRLTPNFNTFLGRTAWQAMQRKVGEDRDQARWSRLLINPPEFSDPAGPKALPPGVSAEQPGILDRIGDYFSGGTDTPAPASDDGPRRGRPRGRGRVRGRSRAKAIESMSQDEVMDLIYGTRPLSQDEINRLSARLDELGVGQQGP